MVPAPVKEGPGLNIYVNDFNAFSFLAEAARRKAATGAKNIKAGVKLSSIHRPEYVYKIRTRYERKTVQLSTIPPAPAVKGKSATRVRAYQG